MMRLCWVLFLLVIPLHTAASECVVSELLSDAIGADNPAISERSHAILRTNLVRHQDNGLSEDELLEILTAMSSRDSMSEGTIRALVPNIAPADLEDLRVVQANLISNAEGQPEQAVEYFLRLLDADRGQTRHLYDPSTIESLFDSFGRDISGGQLSTLIQRSRGMMNDFNSQRRGLFLGGEATSDGWRFGHSAVALERQLHLTSAHREALLSGQSVTIQTRKGGFQISAPDRSGVMQVTGPDGAIKTILPFDLSESTIDSMLHQAHMRWLGRPGSAAAGSAPREFNISAGGRCIRFRVNMEAAGVLHIVPTSGCRGSG